jgi:hypothetical protein
MPYVNHVRRAARFLRAAPSRKTKCEVGLSHRVTTGFEASRFSAEVLRAFRFFSVRPYSAIALSRVVLCHILDLARTTMWR